MPLPRAFKTDESFLEKIAIGATGTKRTFEDLTDQEHKPIELERGSMSFKIWKAIKIKRVRVPDILCLQCGRRVESRAKTQMEISMSHSTRSPERGWDHGLEDKDHVAFVHCQKSGPGPIDWLASSLVQYVPVGALKEAWNKGQTKTSTPKGAQEGFEIRVTWPAAVALAVGEVQEVTAALIRIRREEDKRLGSVRLKRNAVTLKALVSVGDKVQPSQIVASIVPATSVWPCARGATVQTYVDLSKSTSLSDRYAAVKALGHYDADPATRALIERVEDTREHIYVRVDAAAGLMRRGEPRGEKVLASTLRDEYLENRLEAVIVLGEVASKEAAELLISTLQDPEQHPEIRAGAAWSLGEVGAKVGLPVLVASFDGLQLPIKIEAARALAKIARRHSKEVLKVFPESSEQQRPGIAWALSKAGGFTAEQLLPMLVDEDARQWIAYVLGTQDRDSILPEIERLAKQDPQVYFAVTVLWKIMASWVYGLEEY